MAGFDTTRASLLLRLKDRTDQLSWREFHERYGELLHRYARSRGASTADAEDIVQEVEMAIFKAMEGFAYDAAKGRFRAYLRCAVVHVMARRTAKQAAQPDVLDPATFDDVLAAGAANQDDDWEREWQLHRLRWALRAVAGEFETVTLEAFRLHVLAGLPAQETANRLEMSMASVYQAKSRVLKRVRKRLDQLNPDTDL